MIVAGSIRSTASTTITPATDGNVLPGETLLVAQRRNASVTSPRATPSATAA
ncbi:hypothetical protein [Streptomyces sp. IB2014 016-6]|uniref:hypothetical protein n=1 Tax=Streptomyces sp. IB2014 016-6 TaxID=2517818 RepID=UPI0016505B26|nr:hypothetical protein [Streptomyces sp. IB2014 016-6]